MPEDKVSVICTVYNEGRSMEELLDSLVAQSRTPDEAVFVDAGSDDGTADIIKDYADEHGWIELIVEEGCNIAEGRNTAIENASYDKILTTDGGCVLDEDWVKVLAEKLDENRAVTGNFKPVTDTSFKKALGALLVGHIERQAEAGNLTPSSRSMGIRKEVWEDVGGYPEHLYTGEDTEFCRQVQEKGYEFTFAKDAVVYWEMRNSYREVADQFYTYGEGDARAGNFIDHTTSVFGFSKVFLLVSLQTAAISSLTASVFVEEFLALTGLFLAAPYGYYLRDVLSLLKDPLAFFHMLALVQLKNWAFYTGFVKEMIAKLWRRVP